jgi:uncharacterized membrane protein YecN with MAPEG domain
MELSSLDSLSTVTVVSVALLGVLVFALGANVTRYRAMRGATGNQVPTDPADRMFIAIRAHGNATEYVPTLCVLLLLCDALTGGWWVPALAVVAAVARYVHAVGLLTSKTMATHGPVRDLGAMGTYLAGLALCVTAIVAVA